MFITTGAVRMSEYRDLRPAAITFPNEHTTSVYIVIRFFLTTRKGLVHRGERSGFHLATKTCSVNHLALGFRGLPLLMLDSGEQ